ncbi:MULTISPECIES: peroxiredoxin-like family protein [unclassified Agarivorans]|uniref:peroxiredoxin-like family protein n=1 Tax=unclassified Agarivorans TaxID=2636026 RepID=UPI0026E21BD5|nr:MULTISPECIES: peroxiredoxin-like family protein [unclassified Agarivorans]MDO6683994.1 peroxiredoxin-like family protein [Agarivorans sp. 3_MG-2023]MDO6714273.1 peroxiredoxin-like family protein [Agarivorans sp. 2_MG-2023]
MSLQTEIADYIASFIQKAPLNVQQVMKQATKNLSESNIAANTPQQGQALPSFTLANQNGEKVSLNALLKDGPLVVTFYRGGWCPYCNLELRAYQQILPQIKALGANLVAITPELPDASLSTAEKNELQFQVLSDVNAEYAKSLDIVFALPEELRPIYSSFGIEVEQHNGAGQFDLPLAATFVVAQDGSIASAFVEADYTKRQEPSDLLPVLTSLNN